MGSSSLTRDLNPGPLHWELRALASGPPGKSLIILFYSSSLSCVTLSQAHKDNFDFYFSLLVSSLSVPSLQQQNNKGICHLPLQRLNPVLLQLLAFNTPWAEFRAESQTTVLSHFPTRETGATGLQIDIFRNWFHDPNPCISSDLENN